MATPAGIPQSKKKVSLIVTEIYPGKIVHNHPDDELTMANDFGHLLSRKNETYKTPGSPEAIFVYDGSCLVGTFEYICGVDEKTQQVNPKYLHSNSTSHVWAFSAIAELIDNAYDPDVNATSLIINKEEIGGKTCLVFQDNGGGMDNDHLHRMLSFGFCEKDQYKEKTHLPIGHYGNGFKSGSMRLGKDALVFTRHKNTAGVGFLSQTYLENIKADSVVVPLLEYSLPDHILLRDDGYQTRCCLKAITSYSLFSREEDLKAELEKLKLETTGTKIIIFSLHYLKDNKLELDFDSDLKDIKCREVHMKDEDYIEVKQIKRNSSKYKRSLREYCRILFLRPKMKITLRGTAVRSKIISLQLSHTEKDTYRPLWLKRTIQITFGFRCEDHDSEDYGMMLYHNNRLIKAYEKVGYQKQPNGMGVGVIGVAEVDFLQPTHNKQDFNVDEKYNTVMKAVGEKLNDFWNEKKDLLQSDLPAFQPDYLWANCDSCRKWRRLPKGTKKISLPEEWFCYMNEDNKHNRCEDPEEVEDKDETICRPTYQKVNKRRQKEKKSREKLFIQNVLQKVTQEDGNEDTIIELPSASESDSPGRKIILRKRSANISDQEESCSPSEPSPPKRNTITPILTSDSAMKVSSSLFKKRDNCVKTVTRPDSTLDCNHNTTKGDVLDNTLEENSQEDMSSMTGDKNENTSAQLLNPDNNDFKNNQPITSAPVSASASKDSASPGSVIKMVSAKEKTPSKSSSLPATYLGRPGLAHEKKSTSSIINLEESDLPGSSSNSPINFDKEKLEELSAKLRLKTRILDDTDERFRKFQYNVHHLLSLIVPTQVIGDVSNIEKMVENMIKIKENGRSTDDKKEIMPVSSFQTSPSGSKDLKSKESQCILS
ncbi:MORC CW-type zinc finger protein 3 [Bulinus truncatus]|nr:MORC CW-type zinc finger protein 3 [Bulinus truncatus]